MTTQVHRRCATKSSRFFFSLLERAMQSSMRIRFPLGAFLFSFLFPKRGIRATDTATRRTGDRKSARPSDRVISRAAHTYTGYSCRRTRINRPRDGEPRSLSVAAAVAAATTAVQHDTEPAAKNDHVSSSPRSPAITTGITDITRREAQKFLASKQQRRSRRLLGRPRADDEFLKQRKTRRRGGGGAVGGKGGASVHKWPHMAQLRVRRVMTSRVTYFTDVGVTSEHARAAWLLLKVRFHPRHRRNRHDDALAVRERARPFSFVCRDLFTIIYRVRCFRS